MTTENSFILTDSSSSSALVPTIAPPLSHAVSSPAIAERFDGTNYVVWKTLLMPFLKANHLMSIVDGSEPPPPRTLPSSSSSSPNDTPNPAYTTWFTRDQTALGWLLSTSSKTIITQLSNHKTSASVWSYLASSYAAQSTARAASLRMQLQAIRKGNLTVTEYIQNAVTLSDQLAAIGEPISDTEYHTHLFRGLGSDFSSLATAISVHTQTQPLNRDALHSLILSHEGRLDLAFDSTPPPAAFVSSPRHFNSSRNSSPRPPGPHPSSAAITSQQGLLPTPNQPPHFQHRGG